MYYMMRCSAWRSQIQSWLRDYDKIHSLAVILIYIQIGCALVGSLGALYNGVSLINLVIALFALVAIESSSQSLTRTYAVLLFCALLLDVFSFILFTHEIWHISSEIYGHFVIFSVKLALSMQIIGFSVRLLSSSLWIQMYRLGVSYVDSSAPQEADSDMRNIFLGPATPAIVGHSDSDDVLGGSIYDPVYYSSLFEDGQDNSYSYGGCNPGFGQGGSTLIDNTSEPKPSSGRYSQVIKDDNAAIKFQSI
ncbi:Potassium transporter like [Actinidia chinensis var. chinensis]|uniref:Potassium transporter like n=1 Tax=Actinidia chinensis var. chinensis TaxID=1590841 RepID=A0A2R6QTP8_ACTCC|nr:Potassium transporter like [Actinidia chinensis var. chinensis]